jgi:hypothetical protein
MAKKDFILDYECEKCLRYQTKGCEGREHSKIPCLAQIKRLKNQEESAR